MNTTRLLQRLIEYPTVSRDSNLDLIHFVANYLEDHGCQPLLVHNDDKTKANLYATIGPLDIPGVMLSGHSDVVPTDGQAWSRDPFKADIIDGRMYGRGTTDMKGFIASTLALVPLAAERKLHKPLNFAFSYDEEIGCVGVRGLIDHLQDLEIKPELCIVGEPTGMLPCIAHKGKTAAHCHCTGSAAHSALTDRGLNAIYLATDMINEIRALQNEIILHRQHDKDFEVPYTTLHVGTIEGGTVLNIVPDHCTFKFEIRNLSSDEPDELIEQLNHTAQGIAGKYKDQFADTGIAIEVYNQYPALDIAANTNAVRYVKSLSQQTQHGKIAFGTEGGLFQKRLDIPSVVCGPGSMDQGHKPDEFIDQQQLAQCDDMLIRLLDDVSQ